MSEQPHTTDSTYDALSQKERRFVDLYLRHGMNATAAARSMGYKGPELTGHRMIKNDRVRAAVEERIKAGAMSSDEVLFRLGEQARANLLPFVQITQDGFIYFNFNHPDAKDHIHLIKKIKTKRKRLWEGHGEDAEEWEHEWVEVELYDAQAALQLIGKHLGMFTDRVEHTGAGGGPIVIERVHTEIPDAARRPPE